MKPRLIIHIFMTIMYDYVRLCTIMPIPVQIITNSLPSTTYPKKINFKKLLDILIFTVQ